LSTQPAVLPPGTRVEVRKRFDNSWARGFEVVGDDGAGYRVRRLSDGSELPLAIPPDDVRVERDRRSSGMWWY
jgi:hypothetical protein